MDIADVRPLDCNGFIRSVVTPFLDLIDDIKLKVDIACKKELEKRGGSNFVLHLNEESISLINNLTEELLECKIVNYDVTTLARLKKANLTLTNEADKLKNKVDEILTTAKGSQDNPGWNNEIERKIMDIAIQIIAELENYRNRRNIEEIINNYKEIQTIKNDYDSFFKEKQTQILNLEKRLEQKVYDQDILSIRSFYDGRISDKKKEYNINKNAFYTSFGILITFLLYLLIDILCLNITFNFEKIEKSLNNIIVYILIVSITGLLSFIMSDFRKRMNIAKAIIDEIEQKKVIVDSYSVLLEKKKTISEKNQEKYELDLILSIFQNLLSIKNFGYSHKDMQLMSPNLLMDLVNRFTSKNN